MVEAGWREGRDAQFRGILPDACPHIILCGPPNVPKSMSSYRTESARSEFPKLRELAESARDQPNRVLQELLQQCQCLNHESKTSECSFWLPPVSQKKTVRGYSGTRPSGHTLNCMLLPHGDSGTPISAQFVVNKAGAEIDKPTPCRLT